MTSAALGSFLQVLSLLLSVAMAAKLFTTGLYQRYRVFFFYFLFRVLNTSSPLLFDTNSDTYAYIWAWSEPFVLLFYILVVIELYRLVLERYPGLYTAGRWAMYASVAISVTISVLSLLPKLTPATPQHTRKLAYFFVTERGVDTALAVFIILLLLFLSRYPIKLSRNARVHAVIYCVFFLSNTLGLLMRGLFGMRVADTVNTAFTMINVGSVLAWLILLSPAGEEVHAPQKRVASDHERRLLTQLDTLNATLLRVSRQQIR
jgi:hypothetical protein